MGIIYPNNLYLQQPALLPMEEDPSPAVVTNTDPLSELKYTPLSPQRMVLQEGASIQGIDLVAGTEITFDPSGRIAEIGSPLSLCINGIWWNHQLERAVKQGRTTEHKLLKLKLYPNGQVKEGILAKDMDFGGIVCRKGRLTSLHESGKLKRGYPNTDVLIDEIQYLSWSESAVSHSIELYEDGKVAKGTLVEDHLIQGIVCKADTAVEFHQNGKLKSCIPAMSFYINEIECPQNCHVEFYEDGRLKTRFLRSPETLDGIECAVGQIELYPDQKLKSGSFAKPTEIAQMLYKGAFTLDRNGKIISGEAVEDLTLVLSCGLRAPLYRSGDAIFKWKYPVSPIPQSSSPIKIKVLKEYPFEKTDSESFSFKLGEDLTLFGFALNSGDWVMIDALDQECTVYLKEPRTFNNHSFPSSTYITFNWDGSLLSARSRNLISIQGIACEPDRLIHFYPSGALFQANTATSYKDLPPKSLIQLTPEGKLQAAYLSEDDFQDFTCPRQNWILFDDRERLIRFSPDIDSTATLSWKEDGSLETISVMGQRDLTNRDIQVYVPHDVTIQSIHCKAGWTWFSSTGQLKSAVLAPETLREFGFEDLSLEISVDFADGIFFDFPGETRIQGIPCRGWVGFYPSKRLKTTKLAEAWIAATYQLPKDTEIELSDQESQTLLWFKPSQSFKYLEIASQFQTPIFLHPNGRLKQMTLGEDVGELKKGTQVEMTEEGELLPLNRPKRDWVDAFFADDPQEPSPKKR